MKVLFREYTSYGRGDNECLENQWVDEDTPETRKQAIEDYYGVDWYGNTEDFISGKVNEISCWSADDWDSPTGRCFTVTSKEDAFDEVEKDYQTNKNRLIKLFGEEK